MKSKNVTTIIIEGTDGVGKDTIAHELWQRHDLHYRIYVRGELSDYVYAKKYKRNFISTQRGLPFIYVLLTADKESIISRITKRGFDAYNTPADLDKVDDQDLFLEAAEKFALDYHIIKYDTTNKMPDVCANEILQKVEEYCQSIKADESLNEYNQMYKNGCDKLGLDFYVKNNQPYIDNQTIMADAQLHNGSYETFSDKTMPHNFIFSLGYDETFLDVEKPFDFCYIIGSKINVRPEVNEYLDTFKRNHLKCITKETYSDKVFGNEYLKRIAQAKATVYCCRDLAYLKMITVRPYEAALAGQILFVDKLSDPDNEILQNIHGKNSELSQILYITPQTIHAVYSRLTEKQIADILSQQLNWYLRLCKEIGERYENIR